MVDPYQETGGQPVSPAVTSGNRRNIAANRIRVGILLAIQLAMAVELFLLLREGLWLSSAWSLAIMANAAVQIIPIAP